MNDQQSNLVISSLSGLVTRDGITVEVNIVRMDNEADWSLEDVSSEGTSMVLEDVRLGSCRLGCLQQRIHKEGMMSILDSAQIIPFPTR